MSETNNEETIFNAAEEASTEATQVEENTTETAPTEETPAESTPVEAPAPAPAPTQESSGGKKAWQERAHLKDASNDGLASQFGTVKIVEGFAGAGAGGGLGLNAPGKGPKVTHFAAKAKGRQLPISDDCENHWNQVLDNDDDMGFVVLEYDSSGKSLTLKKSGPGGLKEFMAELEDDKVTWGGFRCWAVDDRGNTVSKRAKFVFVQWMPSGSSAMRRAKMGPHKGSVKEVLHSAHLDVQAEDLDAFKHEELVASLQAATGAHKPNGYEFEAGTVVSADYYGTGIPGK